MGKPGRLEFGADVVRIAAAIAPFATSPDFLKYPEEMKAKSLPNKILQHKHMWMAISAVHATRSFSPTLAENIMMCVAQKPFGGLEPRVGP